MEYHHKLSTTFVDIQQHFSSNESKKAQLLANCILLTQNSTYSMLKKTILFTKSTIWHVLNIKATWWCFEHDSNNMTRCDSTSYAICWKSFKINTLSIYYVYNKYKRFFFMTVIDFLPWIVVNFNDINTLVHRAQRHCFLPNSFHENTSIDIFFIHFVILCVCVYIYIYIYIYILN